ncbi:hypothetical protein LZZ85_09245 [Terrimonas sp. NA20]|uniref:FecR protein domain-containing protein n=1 Tax=Terrimonas ginsenosidimutans TaxID=2908004 RepID=A0ABS9KQ59_9BACT|nr:hypothetical protein [Terrimonas ginsenosidimutans]MCG2614465.1 hypothetical protein [Terrimonas ginsenosidimutans]
MKHKLLIALFVLAGTASRSQDMVLNDPVSNKTYNAGLYSEMKGTPFLSDKWTKGTATAAEGTYKSLELKLDAYNNVLFFKRNDEPFEFQTPIKSFVLMPREGDSSSYMYFKKGISGPSLQPNQYVQVLAEGKISLYKSDIKLVSDVNEVNRGVIKAFNNSSRLFVKQGETVTLFKAGKDELLSYTKDHKEKVEAYIKERKLNLKKEKDIAEAVQYYNSL